MPPANLLISASTAVAVLVVDTELPLQVILSAFTGRGKLSRSSAASSRSVTARFTMQSPSEVTVQ